MSDLAAWVKATFGVAPADEARWRRALTHKGRSGEENYERLEFLGDRVLGLSMAEWLYELFPDEPEGMLSRRINMLVSGATCAAVAREIGVPDRVRLDKGAPADLRDSDNVLGDIVEALLAALYIEAGLDASRAWVRARWAKRVRSKASARKHPKAALQEWSEANGQGLPVYLAQSEERPDETPLHRIVARVGETEEVATSSTKKEAESEAAAKLLAKLLANTPPKRRPRISARNPVAGRQIAS